LPVIAHIHGGAWSGGSREGGHGRLAPYVASGDYAAVAIGYRLSGEAIWPAQIYDCKAAIRWIRANAKKYNLDSDKIGVVGESAGGHLVALIGTSGGVEALEGELGPHKGVSSKVQCVVDQYGPSDLPAMQEFPSSLNHEAASSPEGKLIGGSINAKKDIAIAASPITYVSADDPPFLIIHGNKDNVVPFNQSERFYAALKKAKVECYFVTIDGGGHGGFRNPEVGKLERQFFDKHLRGIASTISEKTIPNAAP
jgi:acetyl esterase/lipase